jgi:hypothetical protein
MSAPSIAFVSSGRLFIQRKLEVLARGVGSYDVTRDQSIVYTNGRAIYWLDARGERRELVSEQDITALVALD